MSEPFIRPAVADDYEALCQLYEEGDALHHAHEPGFFQQPKEPVRDRSRILDVIEHPKEGLYVAQVGNRSANKIAGVLHISLRHAPQNPVFVPQSWAVVNSVVVGLIYQHTGIGQALMEEAYGWARAQGVKRVELNVWEFNQEAIDFYNKLGYKTIRRTMRLHL